MEIQKERDILNPGCMFLLSEPVVNIATFSKLALVTDHDWLRHSVKLFGALMPTEIMVFSMKELDDAKAWIRG